MSIYWKYNNKLQYYRLGAEGCVDVIASRLTESTNGGTVYVNHLPVVGNIIILSVYLFLSVFHSKTVVFIAIFSNYRWTLTKV